MLHRNRRFPPIKKHSTCFPGVSVFPSKAVIRQRERDVRSCLVAVVPVIVKSNAGGFGRLNHNGGEVTIKPSFAYRQCLPTENPKAAIAYDAEVVFLRLTTSGRLPPSRAPPQAGLCDC